MTALTTRLVSPSLLDHGRLLFTSGIQHWFETGVEPWAHEPNPDTLSLDWIHHYIKVIILSTIEGEQGDTCDEDNALNRQVFENPACGGRILTSWERNGASRIFCCCDDWGGANAYTTVMFASEY